MTRRTARTEFIESRQQANAAKIATLDRVSHRNFTLDLDITRIREGCDAMIAAMPTITAAMRQLADELAARYQQQADARQRQQEADAAEADRWFTSWFTSPSLATRDELYSWYDPDQPGYDAYAGHADQDGTVTAMYDPIAWPNEGYPCQICWAVGRWPWEPMRVCPYTTNPETTYCTKHAELVNKEQSALIAATT